MKVQGNFSGTSRYRVPNPTFGNYVEEQRICRAVGSLMNGKIKVLYGLGKNNGENLNNTVTAVGTAGVAPFFIRFNPLSNEDPKVKSYSALRQPLSAILALGVQLPVMTAYNHMLDRWAASGKVRRIDLSSKPPQSVLKRFAKASYDTDLRKMYAAGITDPDSFLKGRTKEEYIEDTINEVRKDLFYQRRDAMRQLAKEHKPITTKKVTLENGRTDWFHPVTLDQIETKEFVKPEEFDKAKKEVFPEIMREHGMDPNDRKMFNIKIDWEAENPQEKLKKMKEGLLEVPESLKEYKKSAIKESLAPRGFKYSEFMRDVEERAMDVAVEKVNKELLEEAKVKLQTSNAVNDLQTRFTAAKNQILNNTQIDATLKEAEIKNAEIRLVEEKIQELKNQMEAGDEVTKKVLNRAINKLSGKKIEEIRYHGATLDEVLDSVKIKKWLKAEINRREGVFKNFKKLSGLVFGLAILPFTCGLLNWTYPRFMEKFFPSLCVAKKQANAAKEAE